MNLSYSVLSEGHVYNSPRSVDPINTGALKPKVKHSSIINESKNLQLMNPSDFDENTFKAIANISMEGASDESGPSLSSGDAASIYFASLIRTLQESLKDPGEHCISSHDLVEAYNMLSMKIRDHIHDIPPRTTTVTPSFLKLSKDESTTIFNSLMRDIGRALPNPFESQCHEHSFADLSSDSVDDDDDFRLMTENALLCQYALRLASDVFTLPVLYCNFIKDHLASLFQYILSLCTVKKSTSLNMEKHVATALWILKVQQLPFSTLSSMEVTIVSALRNSICENVGGNVGKLDAFKAIYFFQKKFPSCTTWFIQLMPSILNHINSDNPEIAINAALACAGFALAKIGNSSTSRFPDSQIVNAIQTYVHRETSKRSSSQPDNSLHSFFKVALQNGSQWQRMGPPFALTVISTFVVLLDHSLFNIPVCLKFIFNVLRECAGQKSQSPLSVQGETWKTVFWAFSRIPRSSDMKDDSGATSKKEKAFRVVRQDLRDSRRLDLLGFLLHLDEPEVEGNRSEIDVGRAIGLVADLVDNGDSLPSRLEGVAILSRMVASIGSPSFATWRREPGELVFAHQLIDGSFLLQTTPEISVPPANVLIERLPPLTETEMLQHWDGLRTTWVSIAQQVLDSGQELSPEIQQIWQALLLVKAELEQGQEHLSGSSSFSSMVVSIVEGFSTTLDTVEMQICYLSFIKKLWTVVKNVFTESWLSSPGESILALLLKRQFMLSDDRIKDLWSQLCADLISVGIPGFLRLLHLCSESEEKEEVTRQMWVVLAQNDSLVTNQENWEALLNLLLMPFGVWYLSPSDCEIWEGFFGRVLKLGAEAGRTYQDIVSHFISLCKEPKLHSLKQSPKILRCLLAQSTLLSPPCSTTKLEILSWIDDSLFNAYGTTAEKSWALDSLRLIGEVISNTGGSDIVKLLCVVQKSLVRWIADEERQLDDHEDKELVDILYTRSLEILARVEPSITVLQDLAAFLQSVFLRIRGQGPVVFLDFWRSTYHGREDVPKNEYPLILRQCLKAWGDVTQNSLGFGFSLDSGSQSLQSFTIPDSQLSALNDADMENMDFDLEQPLNEESALLITAHDYSQESTSRGVITPVVQRQSRGPEASFIPAPAALQDYSSHPSGDDSRSVSLGFVASTSKRPADSELPHTPKRSRKEAPRMDFVSRTGKGKAKAKADYFDFSMASHQKLSSKVSTSKPVTRLPSLSILPQKSLSQPSQSRRANESNDAVSRLRSMKRLHSPAANRDLSQSASFDTRQSPETSARRSPEDYDAWEQPVSLQDLKRIRAELHASSDLVVPDSEEIREAEHRGEDDEKTDNFESDDVGILSPSLGEYPFRSRARDRSQTVPEQHTATFSPPFPTRPLRRNCTTPLDSGHKRTLSAQLDVLQQAYATVADTGASQVDVQDIMHAKRLLNQINQVLDEQMCSKIGPSATVEKGKGV